MVGRRFYSPRCYMTRKVKIIFFEIIKFTILRPTQKIYRLSLSVLYSTERRHSLPNVPTNVRPVCSVPPPKRIRVAPNNPHSQIKTSSTSLPLTLSLHTYLPTNLLRTYLTLHIPCSQKRTHTYIHTYIHAACAFKT